jgi:hypothetical protein
MDIGNWLLETKVSRDNVVGKMKDSELLDLSTTREELSSYIGISHALGYPISGRN